MSDSESLLEDPSDDESDDDDDLSDDGEFSRAAAAKVNGRAPKNIRSSERKNEDSDSDFDL